jgi:hypothetical protein
MTELPGTYPAPDPHNTELTDAVHRLAEMAAEMGTGDTWGSWNCGEIEALADVFRAVGEDDVADFVVEEHSVSDDSGDQHYQMRQPVEHIGVAESMSRETHYPGVVFQFAKAVLKYHWDVRDLEQTDISGEYPDDSVTNEAWQEYIDESLARYDAQQQAVARQRELVDELRDAVVQAFPAGGADSFSDQQAILRIGALPVDRLETHFRSSLEQSADSVKHFDMFQGRSGQWVTLSAPMLALLWLNLTPELRRELIAGGSDDPNGWYENDEYHVGDPSDYITGLATSVLSASTARLKTATAAMRREFEESLAADATLGSIAEPTVQLPPLQKAARSADASIRHSLATASETLHRIPKLIARGRVCPPDVMPTVSPGRSL